MRFVRMLAALTLTAGLTFLPAQTPACACSCVASTQAEHFARAEVVFVGVATKVERTGELIGGPDYPVSYTFKVEQLEKGEADAEAVVATGSDQGMCGERFQLGGRYRIYSGAGKTSICSGNEDLGVAYETQQPTTIPLAQSPTDSLWLMAGVAVFAALSAAIAYVLYRRVRRPASYPEGRADSQTDIGNPDTGRANGGGADQGRPEGAGSSEPGAD